MRLQLRDERREFIARGEAFVAEAFAIGCEKDARHAAFALQHVNGAPDQIDQFDAIGQQPQRRNFSLLGAQRELRGGYEHRLEKMPFADCKRTKFYCVSLPAIVSMMLSSCALIRHIQARA